MLLKPLCLDCYKKVNSNEICSYCGTQFLKTISDDDPYSVYLCERCTDLTYDKCKLCLDELADPIRGKPLCWNCYSFISQVHPGIHTPSWIKKKEV